MKMKIKLKKKRIQLKHTIMIVPCLCVGFLNLKHNLLGENDPHPTPKKKKI